MNKEIEELLPFYVNGTLEGDELNQVEKAIQKDPSLADEVEFLKKLRGEIKAEQTDQPPGELGLKRLQKQLQEQTQYQSGTGNNQKVSSMGSSNIWRAASIAACLLLIIQAVAFFPHWPSDDLTASGNKSMVHTPGIYTTGKVISITFVPDATEDNIRHLLLTIEANIVEGPSALGVYKIVVANDIEPAIDKLKAHKNLIESVQYDGMTQ